MTARLHLSLVRDIAELEAVASDYEQLQARGRFDLPFQTHDWHAVWWRYFAQDRSSVRDELLIHIARTEDGECVGIVPLVLTLRPGRGPLRVGSVNPLGMDPNLTEIRTPMILPEYGRQVARAVDASLAADPRWDWIHWSASQSTYSDHLRGQAEQGPSVDPTEYYLLQLTESWESFRQGLKRNIRESIRHCYNSLKREGLDYSFEVASSPEAVDSALGDFFTLHGARAALSDTVEHPDRFGQPALRAFLREVSKRMAQRDRARVFMLRVNGQLAAIRVGFEINGCLYLYYSGFDPAFRKYSVMTTLVVEAIRYAIQRQLRCVNLSAGRDVSKTRWGAVPTTLDEFVQVRTKASSRIACRAYHAFRYQTERPAWQRALRDMFPRRSWS